MSDIIYFDRMKRFGYEIHPINAQFSRLIIPDEYKSSIEDLMFEADIYGKLFNAWRPYGQSSHLLHVASYSEPKVFIYQAWRFAVEKETALGNVLYPPYLSINIKVSGGEKKLIDIIVNPNDMLFGGIETVCGRVSAVGLTKPEIKAELMDRCEKIIDRFFFDEQNNGCGHKDKFEDMIKE